MKLDTLTLNNFGPFRKYEIPFALDDHACILLTGKNNEGKSNIILAIKLLSAATRSVARNQFRIVLNDDVFYKLPQPDTDGLLIGRLLHNYQGRRATIDALFDNKFRLSVTIDSRNNLIYSDHYGRIPPGIENTFGIIPPLGPLAEEEDYLTLKHVKTSINTTLAPRHLRNHFAQILTDREFKLVQDITSASWPQIELLPWELDSQNNSLKCFFKENRIDREISWAGQGLQIWFQIVTHLVRLRDSSMIILDEPEINLHPEKQNDLIRLLQEYHAGSALIATHSVELMNNVSVSHIVYVQKSKRMPTVKSTRDRTALEVMRSQIGSNFNLIASQFESFNNIIFTEEASDFNFLTDLGAALSIKISGFNIPLHGFSEYKKAIPYKAAYKLLIGRTPSYSMLLDRDYYPSEYIRNTCNELADAGIRLVLTPGKEIENLFLSPATLRLLIPCQYQDEWFLLWDQLFEEQYLDCHGSFLSLHEKFLSPRLDLKTITKRFTPDFDAQWKDPKTRHLLIGGKTVLQKLRGFYRDRCGKNLTRKMLVEAASQANCDEIETLIYSVFNNRNTSRTRHKE